MLDKTLIKKSLVRFTYLILIQNFCGQPAIRQHRNLKRSIKILNSSDSKFL